MTQKKILGNSFANFDGIDKTKRIQKLVKSVTLNTKNLEDIDEKQQKDNGKKESNQMSEHVYFGSAVLSKNKHRQINGHKVYNEEKLSDRNAWKKSLID